MFRPVASRVLPALVYQRWRGRPYLFRGGPVCLEEISPKPLPGPSWVRVRSRLAGICGTDLNTLQLRFSFKGANMARKRSVKQPFCLGHEVVGEVVELGAAVKNWALGQRVVLAPGAACAAMEQTEPCDMCRQGLPLLCLRRDGFLPPLSHGAGWSESMVRHESELIPIPNDITDDQAVLLDPLGCSAHAVLRRPPEAGEAVIVIGGGTIGLGMILALKALALPIRIIAVAKYAHQAVQARAMGAHGVLQYSSGRLYEELAAELGTEVFGRGRNNRLLQYGAAVVYDAVGSGETLHHALRWTRPRGAVVLEGIAPRPAPLDRSVIWLRELNVIGAHGHGWEHYEGRRLHTFNLIMDWIRQGRLSVEGLISHRYPLKDYRQAIRTAAAKAGSAATKVLLQMKSND